MKNKTKNKKIQKNEKQSKLLVLKWQSFLLIIFIVLLIAFLASVSLYLYFLNRFYPGISVAHSNLTALTPQEAQEKLTQVIQMRQQQPLVFSYKQPGTSSQEFKISLQDSLALEDLQNAINKSWEYGHQRIYSGPVNSGIDSNLSASVQNQIDKIADQVDQPAINAELKFQGDQINVTPSQGGFELDKQRLKKEIVQYLNTGERQLTSLPITQTYPKLSYENALLLKKKLDAIKQTPLTLTFKDQSFPLDFQTATSLVDLSNMQPSLASTHVSGSTINLIAINFKGNQISDSKISLNPSTADPFIDSIASQLDKDVQEPLFSFDPNSPNQTKVQEFRPPQEGIKLNKQLTKEKIADALLNPNQTTIQLPVDITEPKNRLTNQLGIKERIAHGESSFDGSIDNRIFNVKLAASRLNGALVSPGEVFSFNKTVGDISAATGYKPAYVIKSGRTVLDDGGGVCQVSTTLFRAVLNSGLPVVERTAHAYRVHYYENGGYPPGVDATTFYPSVDFKFKNDTQNYILIQAYYEGLNLFVDFYGTSDGRVATVTKPVITSQTPPPDDLRQDDPTLPVGTVKQVDWAAWGANVSFKRTVVKNGQTIINETFHSNYRPWQAVYLVGTKTS